LENGEILVRKKIDEEVEIEVVYDPTSPSLTRTYVKDGLGLGSNTILKQEYWEAQREAREKLQLMGDE